MSSNDEILEFAVGLQKDPSWDRLMATMPADVKTKMSGAGKGAFGDWEKQGKAMFARLGAFAVAALGGIGAKEVFGEAMNVEESVARLARSANLTKEQEIALGKAVDDTAAKYGASREDQLAALQAIQDKYAVVGKMADEDAFSDNLKTAALVADAYGMSLDSTLSFMGALQKTGKVAGADMLKTMAMLEQAANMGSIGFKEMGGVFPELLAEAAQFGEGGKENVQDVAAALEALTAKIQDPARATTYLRGTLAKLKDADVGQRMMNELGVATKDANGEFRSLSNIVNDVISSMEGRSSGEQAALLKTIFGSEEAVSTMSELIRSGGTFKAILELDGNTRDFMKNLEEANSDTASSLAKLKESAKGFGDALLANETALGLASGVLDNLTMSAQGLSSVIDQVGKDWTEYVMPEIFDILGIDKEKKVSEKELNDPNSRANRDLYMKSGAFRTQEYADAEKKARAGIMSLYAGMEQGLKGKEMVFSDEDKEVLKWYMGTSKGHSVIGRRTSWNKFGKMSEEDQLAIAFDAMSRSKRSWNEQERYDEYAKHLSDTGQAYGTKSLTGSGYESEGLQAFKQALKEGVKEGLAENKIEAEVKVKTQPGGPPAENTVMDPSQK